MRSFIEIIMAVIVFIAGFMFGIASCLGEKDAGAMEVYRGNTKLQYTIVDSVKVDSCVIFLNK